MQSSIPGNIHRLELESSDEETSRKESATVISISNSSKIFIYGIALAAGTGIYAGLSVLFGTGMSGFPSFDTVEIQRIERRTFLPGNVLRGVYGIRSGDVMLWKRWKPCCICCGNCDSCFAWWNHEKTTGSNHAFILMLSCENVFMDFYCGSSGK